MNTVVTSSYLCDAGAYLVLALLLVGSWRRQRIGGFLILAVATSAAWGAFLAYAAWRGGVAASWLFVADALRYGAWFGFLTALLGSRGVPGWIRTVKIVPHASWIALALYGLSAGVAPIFGVVVPYYLVAPVIGMLVLALFGLMLLEQLYRNVSPSKRWALKFFVIAMGTMFAYDIFMYSYAALYGHINGNTWAARGFINTLVVPLLAVAAARNRKWAVPIGVSRRAVFYSTSLFVVTLYVFATAVGGYFVRIYGGDWGRVAEITLACFAGLLLLVLVFSGQVRARFRLFLYKNFFSYRHDYREEWIRLTAALAGGEAELPLRAIHALARIMESPAGALFVRDDFGSFVSRETWNMPGANGVSLAAEEPAFEFMRRREWIYDVTNDSPMRDPPPAVPHSLATLPRAWLMVPLILDEELTGFVVLAEARARRRLNWEDIDLLRTAGRQVASTLAQQDNARRLAEAQQFEGFNRLTAFMMHDLKNLAAQQALMLENAERHKTNPAFIDDMLATAANAVRRTNRILEQLKSDRRPGLRGRVCLMTTIEQAIANCVVADPKPVLTDGNEDAYVLADADQLASVLGHLIRNAQEAVTEEGRVELRLRREGNEASVEVRDNGRGMDEDFIRTRLFKPFFTTKGSRGMGIGAYQAKEYVQSLGGRLSVTSSPGAGTTVRLTLPLDPSDRRDPQSAA